MNADELPVFQRYDISELSRRTGYSELYLLELKKGVKPMSPRFKRMVALTLGEKESDLFEKVA